ncbi:FMN-dependent NADH-azoreductase [Roseibium hamelinense]|uniref:FMN dependent NADH:quinone oxidoreductase n=1 Tax=Roseibium hamelinense TaxID=150831 RepID=A0A562T952_9HYPH|nr:NAD(P)H-dependent oxidoreductase [Roseibium hamelinense]MTI45469.1 FMN-dependent NADH-azoreductase [Roseibium hamelinense]TWI90157.1 FMN-dependent NADH-azoreductase [Roseibium hamelinense]
MSATTAKILKIDASARKQGSVTRQLGNELVTKLLEQNPDAKILSRDVASGLPVIDEEWVGANFTPAADRSAAQKLKLALSDTLVEELKAADTIVLGVPVYNFGIPAALKSWVDQVGRAGLTFKYTENGPLGLLEGKKAYVLLASGGTKVGSEIDFASGYIKHFLGFIGITDVTVIAADQLMADTDKTSQALDAVRQAAAA